MNYKLAYAIGFHPWEDAEEMPEFKACLSRLLDREELGAEPPYGRALDLGTGSGIWGLELARRGWRVTGVELVEKALRRARERVRESGLEMRLVHGDITALEDSELDSGFELVIDTGTFHGFGPAGQRAVGRGVDAVATADATVLLLVWPRRRRPLIRGATREEVEDAFPSWTVTDVTPSGFELPKPMQLLLRPDEQWYRLRRR